LGWRGFESGLGKKRVALLRTPFVSSPQEPEQDQPNFEAKDYNANRNTATNVSMDRGNQGRNAKRCGHKYSESCADTGPQS
jgi:hypothetical protein